MQAAMKIIQPCVRAVAFSLNHHRHPFAKNNYSCLRSLVSSSYHYHLQPQYNGYQHPYGQPSNTENVFVSSSSLSSSSWSSVAMFSTSQQSEINDVDNTNTSTTSRTDIQSQQQEQPQQQEYASSYHAPVMWKECIDALLKRSHNQDNKKHKNKYKKRKDDDEGNNNDDIENADTNQHGNTGDVVQRPRIFVDGMFSFL